MNRRAAWDKAGRLNPLYYVATANQDWDQEEFFASGEALLRQRIDPWLNDDRSKAIEIGAGAGRLSRALAGRFQQVIALDIAPSMVAKARDLNADKPNLRFELNSGTDLAEIETASCAFVLCVWVFQHIPSTVTIETYVAEVGRVLKATGSFVVQIQGSRFPWPYAPVRNFLVARGFWSRLLAVVTADKTMAQAFPGALLEVATLSRMCQRHGLKVVDTIADSTPGSQWVYGIKASHKV